MKQVSFSISMFLVTLTVQGYGQANSPYMGLNQFINSEFMTKFNEARAKTEQSVIDFMAIAARENFSEEDISKVEMGYNASAQRFNDILIKVKTDLLDRKKRKFIVQFPDDYSRQIEGELNRAKDFYAENYQRQVAAVTGGRITGIPIIVLLPEIIKYGKIAFQIFQTIKAEMKKYNEIMIEEHLILKHSFHSWNDLKT